MSPGLSAIRSLDGMPENTKCPLVSASNIGQERCRARKKFKKIGMKYALRAAISPIKELAIRRLREMGPP